ncbi:cathepsin B-like [Brevipalpus obovatus]|uniref:cathepsin B-like n=1 Tax=Brevipalpus obovatus TaxID=246614 RepID=UPI003D9E6A55
MLFSLLGVFFLCGLSESFIPDNVHPLSEEMIEKINALQTTWKAGKNFDVSQVEYLKCLTGVRRDSNARKLPRKSISIVNDIPDTFDARTQWPHCPSISFIRDQSNCGSCWAFGAVEAMSDRICIATKGSFTDEISAEDLVTCCDSCGYGCGGGYPAEAWDYWVDKGLVTGGLYQGGGCRPYTIKPCANCTDIAPTPPCVEQCQASYPKKYSEDLHYGQEAYMVSGDVPTMQTEIMTNGPVEADFDVYADFFSYKSGVYIQKSQVLYGGHAIRILGWGIENGTDYWLVANSWGSDWGDKGYFKIRRGTNECGIEYDVNAGLPQL